MESQKMMVLQMTELENDGTKELPITGYVFKVRALGFRYRVKVQFIVQCFHQNGNTSCVINLKCNNNQCFFSVGNTLVPSFSSFPNAYLHLKLICTKMVVQLKFYL